MGATNEEIIVLAAARLAGAEAELTAALGDTPKSRRANKSMVSDRVRVALAEIVAAKRALSELLGMHSRVGASDEAAAHESDASPDATARGRE